MGHHRRYYRHGDVCLVTNRLAQGLPFVPNIYIKALMYGAVARACALNPGIIVCAFEFLQNHYHFIVYIKADEKEMSNWLHDLDDELARIVKKLLGKRNNLKVWAQRPHVAPLCDAQAVIKEFGYCFLNAVEANFCERAADWIGVHSFRFLFSQSSEDYKWVPTKKLDRLPNKEFSNRDIKRLYNRWTNQSGKTFVLNVDPFAWKHLFAETRRLSNEDIRELILAAVTKGEAQCRRERNQKRCRPANPQALALQNPHKHYIPAKRGRRVHCICTDPELRKEIIALYRAFCETCAAVWQAWKKGDFSAKYPPGAFVPPRPPLASALAGFE